MNKFYKRIVLLLVLSMFPINSFALTKTETIYSTLYDNGKVKSTDISVGLTNLDKGEHYMIMEKLKVLILV